MRILGCVLAKSIIEPARKPTYKGEIYSFLGCLKLDFGTPVLRSRPINFLQHCKIFCTVIHSSANVHSIALYI